MCAACVAQGVVYVGGAVAGLQVLGARAKARRTRTDAPAPEPVPEDDPTPTASGTSG
jgi:acetyl/propionyl-CoA carboxylase alpha subunit